MVITQETTESLTVLDVTGGLANAAAGINQFVAESLMVALAVIV